MSVDVKLKNAPLQEVVFEINWQPQYGDFGNEFDLGFDLAQGKFAELIREFFPVHKRLNTMQQLPEFGQPVHQYWTDDGTWPVVHHGPGILTIHQVEQNYIWKDFRKLIDRIIKQLTRSYDASISYNKLNLLYMDAFDDLEAGFLNFLEDNLQTKISNGYDMPGTLDQMSLTRSYVQESNIVLTHEFFTAVNSKTSQKAILMNISAEKELQKNDEPDKVIEELHDICSASFKKILNKTYYDSLNQ